MENGEVAEQTGFPDPELMPAMVAMLPSIPLAPRFPRIWVESGDLDSAQELKSRIGMEFPRKRREELAATARAMAGSESWFVSKTSLRISAAA